MGVLILLDHWGCHVNTFPTGVLLFKWIRSFSTSARSTLGFLTGVCFILPKLPLFSRPPTLFLQRLRFLNQVSIYSCEVSSLFSINVLIRWSLMKMLTSFKFIILHSFFSFPVDPIQAFSVDHIPFLVSNEFSCRCTSQSLTSCYSFVPKCWRYLRRFVFPFLIRSSHLEIVISFKPFNSTGAISL